MTTKQLVLAQFKDQRLWDSCELQRLCGPGTRTRISDLNAAGIVIKNHFVQRHHPDPRRRYFYELVTDRKLIDFKNCKRIDYESWV